MKKHTNEFSEEFLARFGMDGLKDFAKARCGGYGGETSKAGLIGHILMHCKFKAEQYGLEALAREYAVEYVRDRESNWREYKPKAENTWDKCGIYEAGFDISCRRGVANVTLCWGFSCDFKWRVDELLAEAFPDSENRNTLARVAIKTHKKQNPKGEADMSMNKGAIATIRDSLEQERIDWERLENERLHHVERIWTVVIGQSALMTKVKEMHGTPGMKAFCELVGLQERQGYNYLALYAHRDNPQLLQLSQRKAIAMLPLLDDPDVEIGDGAVTYKLDSKSDITLPFDPKAMSEADLRKLGQFLRKQKRLNTDLEKALSEEDESRKKEVKTMRDEIEKLKHEIKVITHQTDDDPYDLLVSALDQAIDAASKRTVHLTGEHVIDKLNRPQLEKLGAICGRAANIFQNFGLEVAEFIESLG
jgi:hypothetical protein